MSRAEQGEIMPAEDMEKIPKKARMAMVLEKQTRIARFKGAVIIEQDGEWKDMTADRFAEACYRQFGFGINKSTINDLEHLFRATAEDMSHMASFIAFGEQVWDMKKLDFTDEVKPRDCVYRVPFHVKTPTKKLQFILDLAMGDEGVYDDIMQSVAPLIMDKKPTGVIWYLGNGANGKSTLVHLLYIIFNNYLTELTVKQLEDERDTPQLNGKLGNVCKESSEGFVEDTRTYKSIGTHEGFSVHKFHSQDMVQIEGNVHHIFSANNIPTFGDKSYGARRRTLTIPFNNRFHPDETFEDRTFTKQFISEFLGEMIAYAHRLEEQGYEYKFSDTTTETKEKYDTDANTAQTYADELHSQELYGFLNYTLLNTDYMNWCSDHGYKPSSINVLRRAMDEKGYKRTSRRDGDRIVKMYVYGDNSYGSLEQVKGRLGIYQKGDSEYSEEAADLPREEQRSLLEDW